MNESFILKNIVYLQVKQIRSVADGVSVQPALPDSLMTSHPLSLKGRYADFKRFHD